jgi:outer membrane protein OmpA-like peptidoglycan-associated protein/flagellar hook assembly protein FlgD
VVAPDGEYSIEMDLFYEKGNRPRARSVTFILDTVYPATTISTEYTLFSPDGDGKKDTLTLKHRNSTTESRWTGQILGSTGEVVREQRWSAIPSDFVWDGKDSRGNKLSDGEFTYRVSAIDRAGNNGTAELKGIMIDTRSTPVSVKLSEAAFSPNNDGVKDTIQFIPEVLSTEGINTWVIRVLDRSNRSIWQYNGTSSPVPIRWDGKTSEGRTAADGEYSVLFEVLYANGSNPKKSVGPLIVDTLPPSITAATDYTLFSPDGDGRKDTIRIVQNSSSEDYWKADIYNVKNSSIRQFSWKGKAGNVEWDGKDMAGSLVQDGSYRYTVGATDQAGNKIEYQITGISIDTQKTPVRIMAQASGFSPNGDGKKDSLGFDIYAGKRDGIASWSVAVINEKTVERTQIQAGTKGSQLPASIMWIGKDAAGKVLREDSYYAVVTVEYEKGNYAQERSARFVIDVTPPQVQLTLSPVPFSPDDDGIEDSVRLGLSATDSSPLEEWQMQIIDPAGNLFTEFSGTGAPPVNPIEWNGKAPSGELVQAASDYMVRYLLQDIYENTATGSKILPVDVYVLREGDRLRIQISSIYFAPFSTDFQPGKEADNQETLRRIAQILNKYSRHQIVIEGHAVRIYWFNEAEGKREESEILLPLSEQRADVVKKILTEFGVREQRMSTVGLGGTQPVVPHSDLDNRWKNRRVEFILKR